MDITTADILRSITARFYRDNHDSFSQTRRAPWSGWTRCLEIVRSGGLLETGKLSVLDLACGNLRFEAFLERELPSTALEIYAVDDCDSLVPASANVHYQSLDMLAIRPDGTHLDALLEAPRCDLCVSFGFMHHIPLPQQRMEVLEALVRHARPGGYVIVSFWQFMRNEKLAEKARKTHALALEELQLPSLDEGDYLLGWKDVPGAYRYCHSFSESEIDAFIDAISDEATLIDRFTSDGRTDDLNTYLAFEKR